MFLESILTHPTAGIVCIDFFTHLSLSMRFDHNIRHSGAAAKVTKIKGHSDAILITSRSIISTSSTWTGRMTPRPFSWTQCSAGTGSNRVEC